MTLPWWSVGLLLAYGIIVLLYQGAAILLAVRMPSLHRTDPSLPASPAEVDVVVPARDEADDLPTCLDGLLAQDYPAKSITVVDGGSTDETRTVAQRRAPRVTLLEEPPLPAGWVGKNWGCAVGAAATHADYLLFTDADMRYVPETVRIALAFAEREEADLLSLAPRVEMIGFWERTVLPFMTQLVLTYFRAPYVNRDTSRAAMANGQFLLTRRSSYDRVGGHKAVRGQVLEDVALARRFREARLRLRVAWAPELLTTRMYRDRKEMSEGLLKNLHGTDFSVWRQVGFLVALVTLFWLPLAVLPLGLVEGSALLSGFGAFLWVALFAKHAGFARAVGGRARDGLLFPIAVGYYAVLFARSIRMGLSRRTVTWKGRTYSIDR